VGIHELSRELWKRALRGSLPAKFSIEEQLDRHESASAAGGRTDRDCLAAVHGFGRAGISRKHALAIVNRGGATAAEVIALKDQIQQRVEEIWGVRLEAEPVLVG